MNYSRVPTGNARDQEQQTVALSADRAVLALMACNISGAFGAELIRLADAIAAQARLLISPSPAYYNAASLKLAKALVDAIARSSVEYASSPEEAIGRVANRAEDGDVIVTLGAGNVSQLAPLVLEKLRANEKGC